MAPSIRMKEEDENNNQSDEYDKFLQSKEYKSLKENSNLAPLAEQYHVASQYTIGTEFKMAFRIRAYDYYQLSSQEQLVPAFAYPGTKKIQLPNIKSPLKFSKLLSKRRSPKQEIYGSISLKNIHHLLFAAHGVTENIFFRTYPSPGATHPTEIYIIAWDVQELEPGIYHHNIMNNTLELLSENKTKPKDVLATHDLWDHASCLFVFSLELPRTTTKYGERGYRFALLESGHSSQNLMLAATELGIQTCELGNYYDNTICELIGADGVEHIIGTTVVVASNIKKS